MPHTWRSEPVGHHWALTCQFLPGFLGSSLLTAPEFAGVKNMLELSMLGLSFDSDAVATRDRIATMSSLGPASRTVELLLVLVDLAAQQPAVLSGRSLRPRLPASGQRRIEDVLSYVDREYANDVTLEGAATAAGMTARSLSRFFRERTGRTFTDYVNDVRCAAASRLLIETEMPVARIASDCGYANLSNFNRRFQERLALTPGAYRNAFAPD